MTFVNIPGSYSSVDFETFTHLRRLASYNSYIYHTVYHEQVIQYTQISRGLWSLFTSTIPIYTLFDFPTSTSSSINPHNVGTTTSTFRELLSLPQHGTSAIPDTKLAITTDTTADTPILSGPRRDTRTPSTILWRGHDSRCPPATTSTISSRSTARPHRQHPLAQLHCKNAAVYIRRQPTRDGRPATAHAWPGCRYHRAAATTTFATTAAAARQPIHIHTTSASRATFDIPDVQPRCISRPAAVLSHTDQPDTHPAQRHQPAALLARIARIISAAAAVTHHSAATLPLKLQ